MQKWVRAGQQRKILRQRREKGIFTAWIKRATSREFTMSFQSEARGRRAEAWIGLAHVRPRPGNEILEGAVGAFVPALALASGPKDFVNKVTAKLDTYELDVVEIMDIERCESRFAKQSVSDNIKMLADSLREDNPIKLDAFQTYIKE